MRKLRNLLHHPPCNHRSHKFCRREGDPDACGADKAGENPAKRNDDYKLAQKGDNQGGTSLAQSLEDAGSYNADGGDQKAGAYDAQGFRSILHQFRFCVKKPENRAWEAEGSNRSSESNHGYHPKAAPDGTADPVMFSCAVVVSDDRAHSLDQTISGEINEGLELEIQAKGSYIDASKGGQNTI